MLIRTAGESIIKCMYLGTGLPPLKKSFRFICIVIPLLFYVVLTKFQAFIPWCDSFATPCVTYY